MSRPLLWIALTLALTGCTEFWRGTWFGPDGDPVYPEGPTAPYEHRVEAGETLYSIAFRRQLDFRALAQWNGIGEDYRIAPGQILRLTPPPLTASREISRSPAKPAAPDRGIRTYPPPKAPPAPVVPTAPATPVARAPEVRAYLRWQWPVKGPVLRRFVEKSASKGMDIGGTLGQAVLSTAPGKVVYSGSGLRGYGELIIIKHDDVYLSAYAYNRQRMVKEGEKVRGGQLIAEMGSGPEQKAALHFEIRERGKPINPEKLLPSQ